MSPADLLTFLVADGLLPMVAGDAPAAPPPVGTLLDPAERAAAGFRGDGVTMRYPADGADVMADLGPQTATVLCPVTDAAGALAALDAAIRARHGDLTQTDEPCADGPTRGYVVRVSDRRYARIDVRLAQGVMETRVTGMQAVGAHGAAPAH